MKYNILISTYPFGLCGDKHVQMLNETGWNICYNSLGRRLKGNEVKDMIKGVHGVIAGTEPYDKEVIESADDLKIICRVGVGLDNVDFDACKERNIMVSYTPEAPAEGVADLTVAQIINLFRGINISNMSIKEGRWDRILGSLVSEKKIGVLGVGRIGSRVIKRLKSFGADPIYACDLVRKDIEGIVWLSKEELFKQCDLVTIHIPLNKDNYHCVGLKEMSVMKEGSFIINTSRGPVLDEKSLESLILNNHLGGAALDVFEKEPYNGVLSEFKNVLLTAHIGASAYRSRFLMEYEATEDCIRFFNNEKILRPAM
jgi:D-3-phosphoglycerate dehydrogenase